MPERPRLSAFSALADELFSLSPHIRYLALARGQDVQLRERPGLSESSSSESDRYEELFVNPALLTLARQRGELDCGGLGYVVVAYGSFFQLLLPLEGSHASVAIAREMDPIALVGPIRDRVDAYLSPPTRAANREGSSTAAFVRRGWLSEP